MAVKKSRKNYKALHPFGVAPGIVAKTLSKPKKNGKKVTKKEARTTKGKSTDFPAFTNDQLEWVEAEIAKAKAWIAPRKSVTKKKWTRRFFGNNTGPTGTKQKKNK